jgi:hypothetical protein
MENAKGAKKRAGSKSTIFTRNQSSGKASISIFAPIAIPITTKNWAIYLQTTKVFITAFTFHGFGGY